MGETWVGSPPIQLPRRDTSKTHKFPEYLTYNPSPMRRIARGLIESLRICFPLSIMIAFAYNMLFYGSLAIDPEETDITIFFVTLLIMSTLYCICLHLIAVLMKWLLVGKYRKMDVPMWTSFIWFAEFSETIYYVFAQDFLSHLEGTPFLPTALTMYGIHIGRDCYLETYDFPEPDIVHIGDRVEINSLSEIQPHVYEDRVKKIDHTFIGNDVTIGIRSNILVGAKVGNSCQIGPLSLAMKGEAVPGNMSWVGVPLKPWMQKQLEHQTLSSDEDQSLVLV